MKTTSFPLSRIAMVVAMALGTFSMSVQVHAGGPVAVWTSQASSPNGSGGFVDGGSDWATSANWSNGVPTTGAVADIDTPLPAPGRGERTFATVTTSNDVASIVNVGTNGNKGQGNLAIEGGGVLTVGNTLSLGQVQGATGLFNVSSGDTLTDQGSLIVGDQGTGATNISGLVTTAGTVNVNCGGVMANKGTLTVGENGNGTLIVNGGQVNTAGEVVIASRGANDEGVRLNVNYRF
jgi:hypothetical protein